MAKNLEICYLLDFYGDVLTPKQRDVMEQYYNDDFSLAEIAENFGITRQGVRDSIKRGEGILLELEQTILEVEMASGVEIGQLQGEEVRETGFLRVTVVSENPADGKVVAETVLEVLPRRAEEVLGFGITAADDGVTEKVSVWAQVLAGVLVGVLGCGGLVAGVEILGKEKASLV